MNGHVVTELMKNDSRVTYDCHPADIGSYGNFNHGIRSVRTPFFSLLSDDDFLVPDYARAMECLPATRTPACLHANDGD